MPRPSSPDPDLILACRIRAARLQAGATQVQLAEHLGVHPNTVVAWELGNRRPSLDNLRRLAAALGVSLTSLLE